MWYTNIMNENKEIISKYMSHISRQRVTKHGGFNNSNVQSTIAQTRERNKLEVFMSKRIIHGENAIMPVTETPEGLKWHTETHAIIGHSETGHNHLLEATKDTDFDLAEIDGKLYLRLSHKAKVVHQKSFDIHETVELEPGVYVVTRKTEYDPFAQVRRAVYD